MQGQPLWTAVPATLPDLNNPYWRKPLDLQNFQYPYTNMDLPTPKPDHLDPATRPNLATAGQILGQPVLTVDRPIALITVDAGGQTPAVVTLSNGSSGVAPWRASANKPWLHVSQQAGVAAGDDLQCAATSPCQRSPTLTISVDQSVSSDDSGIVTVRGLGPNPTEQDIAVFVRVNP